MRTCCRYLPLMLLPLLALGGLAEPAPESLVRRRVLLDPTSPDFESWRKQQGPLVQMPRGEFEALVRAADEARGRRPQPPRLLEASYQAKLVEAPEPYLSGSAQWKVHAPGPEASFLSFVPFSLALQQARFENREAHVGFVDGQPALWLDQAGDQTLALDWSARGDESPDGYHFDWQVPAVPLAVLELEVPAGRKIEVAPEDCLVSGPHPADREGRNLWKVRFAGRSRLHLRIGRSEPPPNLRPPLVVLGQSSERYALRPDGVEADYQFEVQPLGEPIRELTLLPDPGLTVYQVQAVGLQRWEARPARDNQPAQLHLRWTEPVQGIVAVNVRGLAGLGRLRGRGSAQPGLGPSTAWEVRNWTPPALRLAGALPRQETIELRCHPELQLQEWSPGAFQVSQARTDMTGWHRLQLTGAGVPGDAPRVESSRTASRTRPSVALLTRGAVVHVRQVGWWQLQPRQSLLTAQLEYEVQHGRVSDLPILIPEEWELEQIEALPRDAVRTWTVTPAPVEMLPPGDARPRSLLVVELQRPLQSAGLETEAETKPATLVLTVALRGKQRPGTRAAWTQAFPELLPVGAQSLESGLGVDYDEGVTRASFTAEPSGSDRKAARPLAATPAPESGPWGSQPPDSYFVQRGRPVQGRLRLLPRAAQVEVRTTCDVRLAPVRSTIEMRLEVEALSGMVERVDLGLSAPGPGLWRWAVMGTPSWLGTGQPVMERQRSGEIAGPVSVLAASSPLTAASHLMAMPAGATWQLRLPTPLPVGETLRLATSWEVETPVGAEATFAVPLLSLLSPGHAEGEVRLYPAGIMPARMETLGLQPLSRTFPASADLLPWRSYRQSEGLAWLRLRGLTRATDASPQASAPAFIDEALLHSTVGRDGGVVHRLNFRVQGWSQPTLPVHLPPGSVPLRVSVGGLEAPAQAQTEGGPLELPVPRLAAGGPRAHLFEVVYRTESGPWSYFVAIDRGRPVLPLPPLRFQRRWRLAADAAPVASARVLRRLPAPAPTSGSWLDWPVRPFGDETAPTDLVRPEAVIDAQLRLRNMLDAGQGAVSLGELVDMLAFRGVTDVPLIVDQAALRSAGLSPRTPAPRPTATSGTVVLEPLGLALVPAGRALILTTSRERDAWERRGVLRGGAPTLHAAAQDALRHGGDGLGRFLRPFDWLLAESRQAQEGQALVLWPEPELGVDAGVEWEELSSAEELDLWLIRQDMPVVGGLALAALLLLAWGLTARLSRERWREQAEVNSNSGLVSQPRWRLAWLLLWLGTSALGLLWLPGALRPLVLPALLAGGLVAIGWWGWVAGGRGGSRRSRVRVALRPASASLVLLGLGGWLLAQPPAPSAPGDTTVYLLPGPKEEPQKQTVLLTPTLRDQLERQARPVKPSPRAVLVNSEYRARLVEGSLWVDAEFQVFCPEAGPVSWPLLIEGAVLRDDVLVNGARAYPVAQKRPRLGYTLKLEGQGLQRIRVPLAVPIKDSGNWKEAVCTLPRTLSSRWLWIEPPESVQWLQAVTRCGEQGMTEQGGKPAWQVELGPVQVVSAEKGPDAVPLRLRWRQSGKDEAAEVRFQEAYLWDLSNAGHRLQGVVRYQVRKGVVRSLKVDVPAELWVAGVEARRPGKASDDVPVRLRQWQVVKKGKMAELQLDFQGPVSDSIEVLLTLLPTTTLEDNPASGPRSAQAAVLELPLPEPQGQLAGDRSSHLGYRLQGLQGRPVGLLRVTAIDPREFPSFLGQALGESPALDYAAQLRREPGKHPQLRLRLEPTPPSASARQQLTWQLAPGHADLRMTVEVMAPDNDLSLLEWSLPGGLVLTQVSGTQLRQWSQQGSRLQVWLKRSADRADLRLAGYLPLATSGWGAVQRDVGRLLAGLAPTAPLSSAGHGLAPPPLRFLLEAPQPLGLARSQTTVTLTAAPAWDARLAAGPDWEATGPGQARTQRPSPAPLLVRLEPKPPLSVSVLQVVEKTGPQVRHVVHLAGIPAGTVFDVELLGVGRAGLTWEVSGATRRRETALGGGDRRLRLEMPGRAGGVTLTARVPLEPRVAEVAVPAVRVAEAARQDRVLATIGVTLTGAAGRGLRPLAALAGWPTQADALKRAGAALWQDEMGEPRQAALGPRELASPVRVLRQEHALLPGDESVWVHESHYWLAHSEPTVWWLALPEGARLAGVSVEGGSSDAPLHRRSGGRRLEVGIPLPGPEGSRRVRITWTSERLSGEVSSAEVLQPGGPASTGWLLWFPAESRLAGEEAWRQGPLAEAQRWLAEAEAEGVGARLVLGEEPASETARRGWQGGQHRFALACLAAERQLATARAAAPTELREADALLARLTALRSENERHARAHGLGGALASAQREAAETVLGSDPASPTDLRASLLWETANLPAARQGLAQESATTPPVGLVNEGEQSRRRTFAATAILIGTLALVWLLARLPSAGPWLQRSWPEQVCVLGLLAGLLFGWSPLAIFLLALGGSGRLLHLSGRLLAWLGRRTAPVAPASDASPVSLPLEELGSPASAE